MVINENTGANATRSLENYQKLAQNSQTGPGEVPVGGGGGGSNPNNGSNGGGTSPTQGGGNGGSGSPTTAVGNQPPTTSAPLTAGGINLAVPSTMLLVLGAGFMFL